MTTKFNKGDRVVVAEGCINYPVGTEGTFDCYDSIGAGWVVFDKPVRGWMKGCFAEKESLPFLKLIAPCSAASPETIAPLLWSAYKDKLNEEALEALRQVILDTDHHGDINFVDCDELSDAFRWRSTKQGVNFWVDVDDGGYNKEIDTCLVEDTAVATKVCHDSAPNKYSREIKPGVFVDVYDVLRAWNVTDPSLQHLIKKALAPGQRGHKSLGEDLKDILSAAKRAVEMNEEWEKHNG